MIKMNELNTNIKMATDKVKTVIIGKDKVVDKIMTAILAGGHILLEDIPGVGKTTLALAFSKVTGLSYKRLQFTPDVLPTDVTGFSLYNKKTNEFEFVEGAAMCNLLLADEINRTSPKTQSALLEVMEEGRVTVDSVTHQIPKPFIVIATQNPIGSVGTQKLPESQLDRFMVKLSMGYPDKESEILVLKGKALEQIESLSACLNGEDIIKARDEVEKVFLRESVYEYIVDLVQASRNSVYLNLGISPRGTIALMRMAKAAAFLEDRDYVKPSDVQTAFKDTGMHRIVLSPKAKAEGLNEENVMDRLISFVQAPVIA